MKTAYKASILITRERSTKLLGKKQSVVLFNRYSKLYKFNRIWFFSNYYNIHTSESRYVAKKRLELA